MATKVRELDNLKQGDRSRCVTCNPRSDRISESQLWEWAQRQTELPVHPLRENRGR